MSDSANYGHAQTWVTGRASSICATQTLVMCICTAIRFNIPHSGGQHLLIYRAEPGSECSAIDSSRR